MARTTNITFGQVAAIADAMKAAGNRPTARTVRERIGSGSMGTIHNLLKQWTGKAPAEDETEAAELPSHIQTALMDFIRTEIATACEPINEELQTQKEAADALAEENERLECVIENLRHECDKALINSNKFSALLLKAENDIKDTQTELKEHRAGHIEAMRTIDLKQRQIEMLASIQPELEAAKSALANSRQAQQEAEKNAAVLTAQLEAKTEKADELGKRLEIAESRANAKDAELKQSNNHYQACAARLEAAAREIETLKKPAAMATPKPKATAKGKAPNKVSPQTGIAVE